LGLNRKCSLTVFCNLGIWQDLIKFFYSKIRINTGKTIKKKVTYKTTPLFD